jgi:hypothetical protein
MTYFARSTGSSGRGRLPNTPQGRPWMWASGHNGDIRRAAHGYEATREAAMAAFAKSWRQA